MDKQKPTLHLMRGSKTLSIDDIVRLFKKLTGRDPTPEDIEASRRRLGEVTAMQSNSNPSVTLKVAGRPDVLNPSQAQLFAAIESLSPLGGPGFLALERANGDFAQAAGGSGEYALEWREWLDARFKTFRHFAAGKEGPSEMNVLIRTNGFQVPVRENERLAISDVKEILSLFLQGADRPDSYKWRDISDALGGPSADGLPSKERAAERLAETTRSGQTKEEYLDGLQESRSAKYDEEVSKLSPEDRSWGDPPDEPAYSEEEEFAMLYETGTKPEELADKEEGERYRKWLTMLDALPKPSK